MRLRLHDLQFASNCVGLCTIGAADKTHPNKLPFTGTLLILDTPSDKPPHGAEGHRIFVPRAVAKKRLSTLINMGVNYDGDLSGHAPRHKVGVVTGARISGDKVLVNGFMWQKDFPEVKRDLHAGKLGMSMELSDVYVREKDAPVWYLEDFHFSGATILYKSSAAYTATSLTAAATKRISAEAERVVVCELRRHFGKKTALAASAEQGRRKQSEGGEQMADKEKKKTASGNGSGQAELLVKTIAAGIGPAISNAIKESLEPFVGVLKKQGQAIATIAASVDETKVLAIEAAKREDEEEEEEEEEMEAAHREEEEEDDEMEADSDDDDDDDDKKKKKEDDDDEDDDAELDAEIEHLEEDAADQEPGEVNKDAKNEGDKTKLKARIGKEKNLKDFVHSSSKTGSIRASSVIRELYASHRALRKKYRTMRASLEEKLENAANKVDALEAQVETFAERQDRRSISAELSNFLAKQNVDVREMKAEGRRLTVGQVDDIFANAPIALDPPTRMWFKNQLLQAELMETGEVHRGL